MILNYIILLLFIYLLVSHFSYLFYRTNIIEGIDETIMTEQPQYTDPNLEKDPIYLARINAANITYLKSHIDVISTLKQQVADISGVVHTNSENIKKFGNQMTKNISNMRNQALGINNTPTQTNNISEN